MQCSSPLQCPPPPCTKSPTPSAPCVTASATWCEVHKHRLVPPSRLRCSKCVPQLQRGYRGGELASAAPCQPHSCVPWMLQHKRAWCALCLTLGTAGTAPKEGRGDGQSGWQHRRPQQKPQQATKPWTGISLDEHGRCTPPVTSRLPTAPGLTARHRPPGQTPVRPK